MLLFGAALREHHEKHITNLESLIEKAQKRTGEMQKSEEKKHTITIGGKEYALAQVVPRKVGPEEWERKRVV